MKTVIHEIAKTGFTDRFDEAPFAVSGAGQGTTIQGALTTAINAVFVEDGKLRFLRLSSEQVRAGSGCQPV